MLKEKKMTGLGRVEILPADPVVAGSRSSFELCYTAGATGLKQGGSVRITIPHGFTTPQTDEFYKDGFVSAECSVGDVTLSLEVVSKIYCAYRPELSHSGAFGKNIFVTLDRGELREGDTIHITYGNVSYYGDQPWGPKPPSVPQLSGEHEFTAALDCDGSREAPLTGFYLLPDSPGVAVLPEAVDRLLPVAPSTVGENRSVGVSIIQLDKYLNPVDSADDEFVVSHDGSGETYRAVDGKIELPPVGNSEYTTYNISLKNNKAISGTSNPVRNGKYMGKYNLYWGDIHAHSSFSDGMGTPQSLLAYARDTARLDFSAVTDHDDIGPYLSDEEWEATKRAVAEFDDPGEFTTFLAYEYRSELADMVVYYPGGDGPVMCGKEEQWDSPAKIIGRLRSLGAMIIPHQHFGADWRGLDPDVYRVMEVYSQHGSSEYIGCPRQIPFLTKQLQKNSAGNENATFQEILALGAKLGVTAGSDTHSGRPGLSNWTRVGRTYNGGLTAVFSGEKTRKDIWDALRNRQCYGTTGPRIYLEFSLNGSPMGSELQAGERELAVYCIGTAVLERVEIIKNNRVIGTEGSGSIECAFTLDDSAEQEEDFYYVRVTQADGEMAWSSPIWVRT